MSLVLQSSSGGSVTINEPTTASNFTQTLPAGTGTTVVNGVNGSIVSGTAVASTSGTSIDFTSIPSWVKRVTVLMAVSSTNGGSNLLVQIGSGSVTTSGYASYYGYFGGGSGNATSTAGFGAMWTGASEIHTLSMVICAMGSNLYCSTHSGAFTNGGLGYGLGGGGSITLGGVLDRVRITTVNGTDTFDAGTINILYE
jgi:hypothetical protein